MYAVSPNGLPIIGTLEQLTGRANTADGSFARDAAGNLTYDHEGSTEIFWDDGRTVTDDRGEYIFLDSEGGHWAEDQIILQDEDPSP